MVPVLLISFRRGPKVGVFSGVVFGLAQMLLDGWFYIPVGMFWTTPSPSERLDWRASSGRHPSSASS
ncbi:hypothetical protein E3J20_01735 [Candidatus Bathyarchaeota archaeon]|nr:MAG: hypothetical protein E3J20_01735 [Candidatus Bathyarchaeota archaeon]